MTERTDHGNPRRELRANLRRQRQQLSPTQQRQAAEALAAIVTAHPWYRQASRIGLYLANDGEIDPARILNTAFAEGKQCFLPVITDRLRLRFRHYRPGDALLANRFGIPEPTDMADELAPQALDLLLLPLVGFDRQGNRLGMGGGFYDRSLAGIRQWPSAPRLLGLAHSIQGCETLNAAEWDVGLDGIATEQGFILCAGQPQ